LTDINMRQIEVFLSVAGNQNISKAARELFISQPSISKWIAKMEDSCGVKLFSRTNRGMVLTPEGEDLYARLDIAYHRFRVAVNEICNSHARDPETLRIGCLNRTVTADVTREQVSAFQLLHPEVAVEYEMFNFHELRDKLLCDEIDLALTLSTDIENRAEFDYHPVCDYPAFLIVPGSLAESAGGDGILPALSGLPLVIEAPTARPWAEAICAEYGIVPSGVRYVNTYLMLTKLVERGEGFAVNGKIAKGQLEEPDIRYIPVKWSQSAKVVVAWKKGDLPEKTRFFTGMFQE